MFYINRLDGPFFFLSVEFLSLTLFQLLNNNCFSSRFLVILKIQCRHSNALPTPQQVTDADSTYAPPYKL